MTMYFAGAHTCIHSTLEEFKMWPELATGTCEVLELFHEWKGQEAQAWSYSCSHSQLLIRVTRESQVGGFYLYLKDCYKVSFHDSWNDADFKIEEIEGKYGTEYIVTDSDRLYVHCGATFAGTSDEFLRFEPPSI